MIQTPGVDEFIDLKDAPNSYVGQASKVVKVNAGETAVEFGTGGGGGTVWGDITGTVSNQTDLWAIIDAKITSSWETVSLNLYPYGYTLTYDVDGNVSQIDYSGVIQKTFNYTDGNVTSIVLSGTLPPGLQTTKTLTYDGDGNVDSITYS